MKWKHKNIVISACIIFNIIFHSGCKDETTGPELIPTFNLTTLGQTGQIKTYYKTVADFVDGTTIPSIVPADSIKSRIHYPDSLYNKGVFCYYETSEQYALYGDTLIVNQNGIGYNLFFELNCLYHNYPTDGKVYDIYQTKYLFSDNKIFDVSDKNAPTLVYDFPLIVGKQYTSQHGFIYTVLSEERVITPAGAFNTFKLQMTQGSSHFITQTLYINPQFGIIRMKTIYDNSKECLPWDTSKTRIIQQIQSSELVSIK
jgi:hypothetical protein